MSSENEPGNTVIASKPALSEMQALKFAESLFNLKVSSVRPLPSYDDQNFHIQALVADKTEYSEYVMKIINGEDSKNTELIEAQTHVMMFLHKEGIPTPEPIFTKTGDIMSLEPIVYGSVTQKHIVRLLTYLPGIPIAKTVATPEILFEVGKTAAKIDEALSMKFQHPHIKSFDRGQFLWNLSNTPLLRNYMHAIKEERLRDAIEEVITQFETSVLPKLNSFRKCINHGDLNDHNILVQKTNSTSENAQDQYQISGVLDFSDMSLGYYVFEVAITIMYMMIESSDPLHVGGFVLAGFESILPLTTDERQSLFILVCCRFAQSLVMARYSVLLFPENEEYLMITAKTGWKHLLTLVDTGKEVMEKTWFETAKSYSSKRN
ncbi:hydroxylysine kinase [Bombina bombina]|uniref:hydroxylysine kinase n=1 Tax=Bombina bombina TaxID=8345 RepID=UPI00235AE5F3|nr:hydroxylysine kinase [Bombina bombina]XP_053573378.1 hydroxylysine kinase [Bombina bombina]